MTNSECRHEDGFGHESLEMPAHCTLCGFIPDPATEVTHIEPEVIDPAPAPAPEKQHIKITARGVAVDKNYFWKRIDADTPRGTKIQLYSEIAGLPSYGTWDGKSTFYSHWQAVPSLPPEDS